MSETRKVVRREPEMVVQDWGDRLLIDRPYGNGGTNGGRPVLVIRREDFDKGFVDAEQYAAEQRDKVIRELMDSLCRTPGFIRKDITGTQVLGWLEGHLSSTNINHAAEQD